MRKRERLVAYVRVESEKIEPRRHFHAHVESDGLDGRGREEEFDPRHSKLRRDRSPPTGQPLRFVKGLLFAVWVSGFRISGRGETRAQDTACKAGVLKQG